MQNPWDRPYSVQMEQDPRWEVSSCSLSRGWLLVSFLFESPGLAVELAQLLFGRQVLEIPVSGNTVIILSTSAHKVSGIETSLQKYPHCLFSSTGENINIPTDPWRLSHLQQRGELVTLYMILQSMELLITISHYIKS